MSLKGTLDTLAGSRFFANTRTQLRFSNDVNSTNAADLTVNGHTLPLHVKKNHWMKIRHQIDSIMAWQRSPFLESFGHAILQMHLPCGHTLKNPTSEIIRAIILDAMTPKVLTCSPLLLCVRVCAPTCVRCVSFLCTLATTCTNPKSAHNRSGLNRYSQ